MNSEKRETFNFLTSTYLKLALVQTMENSFYSRDGVKGEISFH